MKFHLHQSPNGKKSYGTNQDISNVDSQIIISEPKSKSEEKTKGTGPLRKGKTQYFEMTLKSEIEAKIQILKMQAIRALKGEKEGHFRRFKKGVEDETDEPQKEEGQSLERKN